MGASEAPILLTHICRDWRSIALSTLQIWSKLYIPLLQSFFQYWSDDTGEYSQKDERRMEARSEKVQKWLQLKAACSINLPCTYTLNSHQPLLNAIIQSSRRWQQLELGYLYPPSDVCKRILSLSADDLCMLRDIRLHSMFNPETDEDLWFQSGLLTAQSLRSISIGQLYQRINLFQTGIPPNWKHLNHLFIHSSIAPGLASQILIHCINLVACLLSIGMPWDMNTISNPFVTHSATFLPHLEFLSLQGYATGCSQLFEAPCLRSLDCYGIIASENEGAGLLTFLSRGIKISQDAHDEVSRAYWRQRIQMLHSYPLTHPSGSRLV